MPVFPLVSVLLWILRNHDTGNQHLAAAQTYDLTELCDVREEPPSACEWTGDCPVEGCSNQCQLHASSVGWLKPALEDRAYDLDWWQLCPDLAMQIGFIRTFYQGEAAPPAATQYATPAFSSLPCPTEEEVEGYGPDLVQASISIQESIDISVSGQAVISENAAAVDLWGGQPNRARWLVHFLSEPQRIVDYMAANCSTTTLGGPNREGWREQSHLGFYTLDDFYDHIGQNDTFDMCMDTFGGYEQYNIDTDAQDAPCSTPFGVGSNISTTCWPPYAALDYWPTTLPCADRMAELHNVDSSFTQQILPILVEPQIECNSKTTEEECGQVTKTEYSNRVEEIIAQIPLTAANNTSPAELGISNTTHSDAAAPVPAGSGLIGDSAVRDSPSSSDAAAGISSDDGVGGQSQQGEVEEESPDVVDASDLIDEASRARLAVVFARPCVMALIGAVITLLAVC